MLLYSVRVASLVEAVYPLILIAISLSLNSSPIDAMPSDSAHIETSGRVTGTFTVPNNTDEGSDSTLEDEKSQARKQHPAGQLTCYACLAVMQSPQILFGSFAFTNPDCGCAEVLERLIERWPKVYSGTI